MTHMNLFVLSWAVCIIGAFIGIFFDIFKARVKQDRTIHLTCIAGDADSDFYHNYNRSLFKTIQALAGRRHSSYTHSINKLDGYICSSTDEVLSREM